MIENYTFGRIVIDGKTYTHDVIISPEGEYANWWRKEGHRLLPDDLPEILSRSPDILIIGRGASGMMKVAEETESILKEKGIELVVPSTTDEACDEYNRLCRDPAEIGKRIVAALHLTC